MAGPDSADDTGALLALMASFQQVTQHADAKVATLVAVHAGLGAVLAGRADAAEVALRGGGGPAAALIATLAVLLGSFVVAGFHLYQALRPRIPVVAGPNRFALRCGPVDLRAVAGPGDAAAELRVVVEGLAGVARTKHRHVARGLAWTAVLLVSALGSLVLIGVGA